MRQNRGMNVASWLDRAARADPGGAAVLHGRALWASYGELAGRVARLAAGLAGRAGLAAGERVAIAMRNAPEYLEALYAAWWAGLAVVPVNAKLHEKEIAYIVEHSGARLAIRDPREVRGLAGDYPMPCAEVESAAPAWLFYTSGTTGRPKGAMLSHRNLAQMTLGYFCDVDEVSPDGRLLHAAPMSHGSGLYTLTHLAKGARRSCPSRAASTRPRSGLLEAHGRVSLFAAPTMVKRLVEAALAGGHRAAGLQDAGLRRRAHVRGGPRARHARLGRASLVQIYGQGEAP